MCLQGIEKLKKQREEINIVAKDNNKKYLLVYSKRYKKVKKKSKRMIKNAKQKPSVNCEDKGKLSFYKNRINVFKKETEILKKLES